MPPATLHRDETRHDVITLRAPDSRDGEEVWRLIRDCGPLDDNSLYCNLLQCDHFSDSCVADVSCRLGVNIGGWSIRQCASRAPIVRDYILWPW